MSRTLIDTSVWIEALRRGGREEIKLQVEELLELGSAISCTPVILEMYNGASGVHELKAIEDIESTLQVFQADESVMKRANAYARALRKKGLTVPAIDIIIQAIADENGCRLFTLDTHFEAFKKIRKT